MYIDLNYMYILEIEDVLLKALLHLTVHVHVHVMYIWWMFQMVKGFMRESS